MSFFFRIFFFVLIIVAILYIVSAIFLTQYVSAYPDMTFIGLALSSFGLVLTWLGVSRIYRKDYAQDTKLWKSYWNAAELVWLIFALFALLAGMSKYTAEIDPNAYDAERIGNNYLINNAKQDIALFATSSDPILEDAKKFCDSPDIPKISTKLCEGISSLQNIENKLEYSAEALKQSAYKILHLQNSVTSFYGYKLEYLLFVFSQGKESRFGRQFWQEELGSYFDKNFIRPEHEHEYARIAAGCKDNEDSLCKTLDRLFGSDEVFQKVIDSPSGKMAFEHLRKTRKLLHDIFETGGFSRDFKSLSVTLFQALSSASDFAKTEMDISTRQPIDSPSLERAAEIVQRINQFAGYLLPLLLGAALGVRFAKGLAAFKF